MKRYDDAQIELLHELPPDQRIALLTEMSRAIAAGDEPESDLVVRLSQQALQPGQRPALDGWLAIVGATRSDLFLPALESWMDDPSEEIRSAVVAALAVVRSAKVNQVLLDVIQRDGSPRVRRHALRYLVRRGSLGEWEPCDLSSIVDDDDWIPVTRREYLKLIQDLE